MNERCKICIDPSCKGRMDCDCSTRPNKDCCYREIRPTIRITRKCTQSCKHCCFSCSPKESDHLTLDTAQKIALFLEANEITYANIMGGEFWLCENWESIIEALYKPLGLMRIVSNGDWAESPSTRETILSFAKEHPKIYFSISEDRWHTNRNIGRAKNLLEREGTVCKIQKDDDNNSVVPVGRGEYNSGIYSMLTTYCSKPDRMYQPLIDEKGIIYKCGFGIWDYATIDEHLDGTFHKCFKEFGLKFNKIFVSNCSGCSNSYNRVLSGERKEK